MDRSGFDPREAFDTLRGLLPDGGRDQHLRGAVLTALADGPKSGADVIRFLEATPPAPGAAAVYPTLQLLVDEGLAATELVGERAVYALTDEGRAAAAEAPAAEPGARSELDRVAALSKAALRLAQTTGQVATSASAEQTERAIAVLDDARRRLHALLAES